jgi:thioesterase domain-containing protein
MTALPVTNPDRTDASRNTMPASTSSLDVSTTRESPGHVENSWSIVFHPEGTLPPLFCIAAGANDMSDYRDVAQAMPEDLPLHVFGVPPAVRGEASPTVQRFAEIYVCEMRKRQPRGPYRLCGHSFGGLVAYEMAVLLAAEGEEPQLVALVDSLHPKFKYYMSTSDRLRFELRYIKDRVAKYGRNLTTGHVRHIGRDVVTLGGRIGRAALRAVRSAFGVIGRPPPRLIHTDKLLLNSAWHRYEPSAYSGPVVLLSAANRSAEYGDDHLLGWDKCASGKIDVHIVPGEHFSIMHPPYVREVAEKIERHIFGPEVRNRR